MIQHGDFRNLNRNQFQASTEFLDKSLMILAAPGSGKTLTLTLRVAYLLNLNVSPTNILVLTFTKKAAMEMKRRLSLNLPRHVRADDLTVGTFHHFALYILRANAGRAKIPYDFQIVSGNKQKKVLESALNDFLKRYTEDDLYQEDVKPLSEEQMAVMQEEINDQPTEIRRSSLNLRPGSFSYINGVLCRAKVDRNVLKKLNRPFQHLFFIYNSKLREMKSIDLGDILYLTTNMLRSNQQVLENYQRKYKYILVDEFQDTNSMQLELIELIGKFANVTVCGDDDQAIYGWRGATSQVFEEFKNLYPESEKIILNENYRSTQHIVNISQGLISNNKRREVKHVFTNNTLGNKCQIFIAQSIREEAKEVVNILLRIKDAYELEYKNIAVLYRLHRIFNDLQPEFEKAGIPVRQRIPKEKNIMINAEIRGLVSYLKFILDTNCDDILLDIINWPKRGIGSNSIDKLKEMSCVKEIPMFEACKIISLTGKGKLKTGFNEFCITIAHFQELLERYPPSALIELMCERLGINKQVIEPLQKLARSHTERGAQGLSVFLESIGGTNELIANVVTLTSIHQAKGQEWDLVFLIRLNESILPANTHSEQLEEERRLAYVACTRSKRFLVLSCAQQSNNGEQLIPSRFLDELTVESSAPVKSKKSALPSPKGTRVKIN
ncbi:unnamed protein product [Blepharisma stoltei]|uniref:DNA 3'-5' helicase n=1 Tax=Blepharisma stoltei TaxID=1481888 RepID=A0AAU9J3R6_9CILI|nr:unnamed protein product [Blepharisma stoltei]